MNASAQPIRPGTDPKEIVALLQRPDPTVADGRRRSQTVADGRRRSQTVADGRRRSQTVADGRRRSQTLRAVRAVRAHAPHLESEAVDEPRALGRLCQGHHEGRGQGVKA